jgi:hypothetical protein
MRTKIMNDRNAKIRFMANLDMLGSSGTLTFALGSANDVRTLTIAIEPGESNRNACCQDYIYP